MIGLRLKFIVQQQHPNECIPNLQRDPLWFQGEGQYLQQQLQVVGYITHVVQLPSVTSLTTTAATTVRLGAPTDSQLILPRPSCNVHLAYELCKMCGL